MKNILKFMAMAALLVSFAACTEKDNPPDGNDNNYSTLLIGTWRVDMMSINGQDMTPPNMLLSFTENGNGLMNDGDVTEHNGFTWVINGDVITVTTDKNQFSFTIDSMTATECAFHGSYIEFDDNDITGDIRFHMTKTDGDNPGGGDSNPGDLGIGTPELLYSTMNSITVTAHVTGSVSEYLYQFPNYTCGIVWCPAYDGTPTLSNNTVNGNPDSDGNFEVSIGGLQAETQYNIVAWLKLTPDSEPIYSDVRTYSTGNASSSGDTNWINLLSAIAANSNTLSVTVTAYFDGDPIGLGVVYNTTGNPTLADNVYNGFEHVNMETGETDATIQRMQENPDGSRTVAALINNMQSGTTYYIRGYMQFNDGTPTIYSNEEFTTTPDE